MHDSQILIREEGVTSPREPEGKKSAKTKALKFCGESKKEPVLLTAQLSRD